MAQTYRFTKDDISILRNDNGSITLLVVLNNKYIKNTYIGYSEREAIVEFQKEFGTYPQDFKPLAKNLSGVAIMEIKDGYVYVCDSNDNGYTKLTKNIIQYNTKGAYFTRYRERYYISDFNKVPKVTYYTDIIYGGKFTYEEMIEDAKKNYDYGDGTNVLTYMVDWWKEHYKRVN